MCSIQNTSFVLIPNTEQIRILQSSWQPFPQFLFFTVIRISSGNNDNNKSISIVKHCFISPQDQWIQKGPYKNSSQCPMCQCVQDLVKQTASIVCGIAQPKTGLGHIIQHSCTSLW